MAKTIIATNETIKEIVKSEIKRLGNNADLNHIDVSQVTDMSHLFEESEFDGDISKWDVSNVTNMECMFDSSDFNGDISNWNVSNVTNMEYMFYSSFFDGDISKWHVSSVKSMRGMFALSTLEENNNLPVWYKEEIDLDYAMLSDYAAEHFWNKIHKRKDTNPDEVWQEWVEFVDSHEKEIRQSLKDNPPEV